MLTVAILDDWPVFALGLAQTIAELGFQPLPASPQIVDDAPDTADIILLSPGLFPGTDLRVAVSIIAQKSPVILLTSNHGTFTEEQCKESGANGYVHRGVDAQNLAAAVTTVAGGGTFFGAESYADDADDDPLSRLLSTRERQVIWHISRGKTYRQIATVLEISPHTVDTYIRRVRTKLGVGNKAELATLALGYPTA